MCVGCVVFFFFKQKTAYEMRISDWSSDVCSSDLEHVAYPDDRADQPAECRGVCPDRPAGHGRCRRHGRDLSGRPGGRPIYGPRQGDRPRVRRRQRHLWHARSEEHTSELQSLMRISYAVFCLKKTTYTTTQTSHT